MVSFVADTEKFLKPENAIKEILKFMKSTQENVDPDTIGLNRSKFRAFLSILYFHYSKFKCGEVFSSKNNII